MAREGSCTVPQMQEVLTKQLSVRKSAVPKWKAQCVEKIFELAKLSTQQATLPAVLAAASTAAAAPTPAAIAGATAAAAAAVQAEDEADDALRIQDEQQRAAAVAAELEDGDEPDTGRGDEPVELEAVEEGSEASGDDGDAADESESADAAGEAASTAAVAALQQLCEEAESDPDAAADAVLAAPSIWRCCSSEARTPAWKCGGCNLWTHRTCQRRACGADSANPLCKACFEEAAAAVRTDGPRKKRRVVTF